MTRKYDEEQEIAFQAGKAMKSITDVALKVNMSLMVHSMGNRVMFSFAKTSDVKNEKAGPPPIMTMLKALDDLIGTWATRKISHSHEYSGMLESFDQVCQVFEAYI